jgi:hypothetical protein
MVIAVSSFRGAINGFLCPVANPLPVVSASIVPQPRPTRLAKTSTKRPHRVRLVISSLRRKTPCHPPTNQRVSLRRLYQGRKHSSVFSESRTRMDVTWESERSAAGLPRCSPDPSCAPGITPRGAWHINPFCAPTSWLFSFNHACSAFGSIQYIHL